MARRLRLLLPALLALLALMTGTSHAVTTTVTIPPGGTFTGPGQEFCGTYTGTLNPGSTGDHSCDLMGHMTGVLVDGIPHVVYSTRYDRPIGADTTTGDEVAFPATGSGLDAGEADQAARVIANYFPNHNPGLAEQYQIEGTEDQKAAAVQAALWHIGDDIEMDLETELGDTTETDFVTYANYLHILDAVADRALPSGEDDLDVHTDGPADGTPVGANGLFGPFTVNTNGGAVEFSTEDDILLVDSSGSPVSRTMHDGDTFWVEVPGLGQYEMEAETAGIQSTELRAWHLTTAQDELATPLADGTSEGGTFIETITFEIYEVRSAPADAVASDPAFTG
jgi:hypothetical protein